MIQNLLPGIQHLQNIHPLVIHFPMAFLFGAALFYVLALLSSREIIATTAFSLLIVGTLGAAAAVGTGIYAEPSVILAPSVRGHLLEKHEDFMIMTLCVSAVLTIWAIIARPFPRKGRGIIHALVICAPRGHVCRRRLRGTDGLRLQCVRTRLSATY